MTQALVPGSAFSAATGLAGVTGGGPASGWGGGPASGRGGRPASGIGGGPASAIGGGPASGIGGGPALGRTGKGPASSENTGGSTRPASRAVKLAPPHAKSASAPTPNPHLAMAHPFVRAARCARGQAPASPSEGASASGGRSRRQ